MHDRHLPLVRVTRGGHEEGFHFGSAIACDATGRVVRSWGDGEKPFFPRSAWKPMQALSLLTSGAADRYDFSREEMAQACASHLGEAGHGDRVRGILARLDLGAGDLACGPTARRDDGAQVSTLYHNCSGKHAGFLATARHLGLPVAGYTDPGHGVQQRILSILNELTGQKDMPVAGDGCTAPAPLVPLHAFTHAMARFADPSKLPDELKGAVARIGDAISNHPAVLEGLGGFTTEFIAAARGRFYGKNGAEAVFTAVFPERGLAITVKIADGSNRALGPAVGAVMDACGLMDGDFRTAMAKWWASELADSRGRVVGRVEANTEVFGKDRK